MPVQVVDDARKAVQLAEAAKQNAIRELLSQRKVIDDQLKEFGYAGTAEAAQRKCGQCGKAGHSARKCPDRA